MNGQKPSPKDGAKRKPEGRAQVAKRQANMRARLKAEGRVRLELWPLAEHAGAVKGYAASLEAALPGDAADGGER